MVGTCSSVAVSNKWLQQLVINMAGWNMQFSSVFLERNKITGRQCSHYPLTGIQLSFSDFPNTLRVDGAWDKLCLYYTRWCYLVFVNNSCINEFLFIVSTVPGQIFSGLTNITSSRLSWYVFHATSSRVSTTSSWSSMVTSSTWGSGIKLCRTWWVDFGSLCRDAIFLSSLL